MSTMIEPPASVYRGVTYEEFVTTRLPGLLRFAVMLTGNRDSAGGKAIRVDAGMELTAVFAAARDVKATDVASIETPATFDGITPEAAGLWAAVRDGSLPQWAAANPQHVDQR